MVKTPKEHIAALRDEYIARLTPSEYRDDFKRENNIENETIREYHGREILELLQNADDAYTLYLKKHPEQKNRQTEVSVLFEYDNGILRVSNFGEPFDLDSIKSLCQGNNSTKDRGEFIGNKGIGFRALLNWSDNIKIISGDFSLQFSTEIAGKYLEILKEKSDIVRKDCELNPKLGIPMLSVPEWCECGGGPRVYDTTIELRVQCDSDGESVEDQVNGFDAFTLLFLRNVSKVTFVVNGEITEYSKAVTVENGIDKAIIRLNSENKLGEFYYFKKDGSTFGPQMAVAIPCRFDRNFRGKMYTFFPIFNVKSPFPLLMHAMFDLPPDRNSINYGIENRQKFLELLEFLVQNVSKHFLNRPDDAMAFSVLKPLDFREGYDFDGPFSGLFEQYLDFCRENIKLQTVNDEFLPITLDLKINDSYPDCFKGPLFKDLIRSYEENDFVNKLLEDNQSYTSEELYEKINKFTQRDDSVDESVIAENVQIFDWWIHRYKFSDRMPNLLKNDKGKWVKKNGRCLFPKEGAGFSMVLPKWAEFTILDERYCDSLVNYICNWHSAEIQRIRDRFNTTTSNKRLAISYLSERCSIDFKEYSANNLISPLNTFVGNDLNRCVELLKWLYENQDELVSESLDKIAFRLPDNELNVVSAKTLFFNHSYGERYRLTESLLGPSKSYSSICDCSIFDFVKNDCDLDSLNDLLIKMGVLERPLLNVEHSISKLPSECNFRQYFYNLMLSRNEEIRADFSFAYSENNDHFRYLELSILKNAPIADVFQWLLEIKDEIFSVSDSVYYKSSSLKRTYYSKFIPFLSHYISHVKWLKIEGKYYSLSECMLIDGDYLKKLLPSCITQQDLRDWSNDYTSPTKIRDLLTKLSVPERFDKLPSNMLYGLLMDLSKDGSREAKDVTRKIYRQCFASDNIEAIQENSEKRTNFIQDGLVLSKLDNLFHHHSQVFFSNKPEVNILRHHLLDMPLRTGDPDKAKKLFFVEKFEENVSLDRYVCGGSDDVFQEKFRDYLPFVYCYRRDRASDTEKRAFRDLKVHLATDIYLSGEEEPSKNIPYFTVLQRDPRNWVISVPDVSYDQLIKTNKNEIYDALEQIIAILLKSENSDFLQKLVDFFFNEENDCRHRITKDFGDYETTINGSREELYGLSFYAKDFENYLKSKDLWDDSLNDRFKKIDFNPWNNDLDNREKLRLLLSEFSITKEFFENVMHERYLFSDSNKRILERCFRKKERMFVSALWLEFDKSEDRRKSFDKEKDLLFHDLFADVECETVEFDVESITDSIFKQRFSVDIETQIDQEVDEKYRQNFMQLRHPENFDLRAFFNQNMECRSLLFFEYESVQEKLDAWIKEKENHEKESVTTQKAVVGIEVVPEANPSRAKHAGSTPNVGNSISSRRTTVSSEEEVIRNSQNEEIGMTAEKCVFDALEKIVQKSELADKDFDKDLESALLSPFALEGCSLNWISGYAQKFGMPNCKDGLGYDIEILNPEGKSLYIEVKGSRNKGCDFYMSPNELKFASSNTLNYRLIFVGNLKKDEKAKVTVLPVDFLSNVNYVQDPIVQHHIYKIE